MPVSRRSTNPSRAWRLTLRFALPAYVLAAAYLLVVGESGLVALLTANGLYLAVMVWLTTRVTDSITNGSIRTGRARPATWWQLGVVTVIVLVTAIGPSSVPIWSDVVGWFHDLGESFLPVRWFGGPGNAIANPIQYFVAPLVLLLALGARARCLGLGRGHRVWRVSVLWLALPAAVSLGLVVMGAVGPQTVARRFIANAFQNGFFEEFLFRGALQTRLSKVMSEPWAWMVQALVFGLWHVRANTQMMDGNVAAGLAVCIVSQFVTGLAFGHVFRTTRNLIAPSVAHVATNVLGQSF